MRNYHHAVIEAVKESLAAAYGKKPTFAVFLRWKPLAQQAIGWEPD
jgi:hypothetical protein